jgi:diadenosine tetraphosphatase ApaH/serine/threonine PP2A family protein phosphatase
VRYAVLSDVHANVPALEAVLAAARAAGADRVLCLGDVVGYGAEPGPVLDRLGEAGAVVVAGNHDRAVAGRMDLDWFNDLARAAAEWTAEVLSPAHLRYLDALPLSRQEAGATLVHASPADAGDWPYVTTAAEAAAALRASATPLAFIGHTHVPGWFAPGGPAPLHRGPGRLDLDPARRYLVNAGSVGQPRDGDPWASYALWDLGGAWVEIRRVAYDAGEARRRILAAGLPARLGDRLLRGR